MEIKVLYYFSFLFHYFVILSMVNLGRSIEVHVFMYREREHKICRERERERVTWEIGSIWGYTKSSSCCFINLFIHFYN